VRFLLSIISRVDLHNGLPASPKTLKLCDLRPNIDAVLPCSALAGKELGRMLGDGLGRAPPPRSRVYAASYFLCIINTELALAVIVGYLQYYFPVIVMPYTAVMTSLSVCESNSRQLRQELRPKDWNDERAPSRLGI
jgi:hypothetical protein